MSDLLDGLLLSDGNLTVPGQCKHPRYQQTCKEPLFLEWVASWLPTPSKIKGPQQSGRYQYWFLYTPTSDAYRRDFDRWYPDGKHIPDDLIITPAVLLGEYLGDGCLSTAGVCQRIEFGTYGFERSEVEALREKLCQVNLPFTLSKRGHLTLRGGLVKRFLEYIGPCPVESLAYKWKAHVVEDIAWREIISAVNTPKLFGIGERVRITLECGHVHDRSRSRLRSTKTNKTKCPSCEMSLGCS